jgi:hypothetical protein
MRAHIAAVATAATVAVLGLSAAAQPAGHQARARASPGTGPITMTGPHMYNPATGTLFPNASTVTVSRNTHLVNEMVHVSRANFTPSSALAYSPSNVAYPVMVTECKGTHPASPADCYGAENGGVTLTSGAFGPMNDAYATTAPNGTGQTDIQILTGVENQFLRCSQARPCSLAIVPSQGGNYSVTPPNCADHSQDFFFGTGYAVGSSMLARAMDSWQAALCAGSHGLTLAYDSFLPEPLAIVDAVRRLTEVARTTRPASAQGIGTGGKHFVYAPVAVSAVSLAYWFDNAGCPNQSPIGCDKGVEHNPLNLFADPEFTKLNPNVAEPGAGAIEVPTVVSGQSDTTWTVTRWIAANKAASQFLGGKRDPYGMHMNTHHLGMYYPTNIFLGLDPFLLMAHEFLPVFPFRQVATDQVENCPPAISIFKDQNGNYDRLPPQVPGQRALIAVTGQGDSAACLFPVAAIANGAGKYVEPTNAGMAAAVKTMVSDGSGTLQVNPHSTNPAVYPLTMVIYAMVPTSGLSHAKAAAIARFIDYAAGAGQPPGAQAGQLPPGFLPLTPGLRAQARKAAQEVVNQTGA